MHLDKKVSKSRDAIKSAFVALMASKHFDMLTVGLIAKRAKVNRGTFYAHYTSKEDLLEQCIKEQFSQLMATCGSSGEMEEGYPTFNSLLATSRNFEQNFQFYSSMLSNQGMTTFRQQLLAVMTTGIEQQINMHSANKGLNKEILVQFMASAIVGIVEWWIANKMPVSPETLATNLWKIIERNEVNAMPKTEPVDH